jgi:hypothetical protein
MSLRDNFCHSEKLLHAISTALFRRRSSQFVMTENCNCRRFLHPLSAVSAFFTKHYCQFNFMININTLQTGKVFAVIGPSSPFLTGKTGSNEGENF